MGLSFEMFLSRKKQEWLKHYMDYTEEERERDLALT